MLPWPFVPLGRQLVNIMKQKAIGIFLHQKRFDLIFKYLYVKRPCAYHRAAYLEHIRAFNGFYELNPSDGKPKNTADDFVNSFNALIESLKMDGYAQALAPIPLGSNGEIQDGAHRLAACMALGIEPKIENDTHEPDFVYDYRFFRRKGMDESVMDYGALEYVKLNPKAHVVNLHSITNPKDDDKVEAILNKYGVIFYKKEIHLTYNGLVNLKKLSYGSFWDREEWIGNEQNQYFGAQDHAQSSLGKYPTRVYVFVCEDLEKVVKAKAEIRDIYSIGNFSVHINDHHDEAVWLAETYFNANSLFTINNRPFAIDDKVFDDNVEYLKSIVQNLDVDIDDVCGAGSTPLNALLMRHSDDLDYLSIDEKLNIEDEIISPHDSQLCYYPYSKEDIITNPAYYQYYHGLKLISLDVLYQMKHNRREKPKDLNDCRMIDKLMMRSHFDMQLFLYNLTHNPVYVAINEYYKKNKRRVKRVLKNIGVLNY